MNNATNAFRQTSPYPFDPNCKSWSNGIETLGLANDNKKGKVQYEVYPLHLLQQLSEEERNILHLDLNDVKASNDIMGDIGVATVLAEHILARWHEDIDKAVSEGEQYEEYANTLIPQAKTDADQIALTLVTLQKINYDDLPKKMSVEETKKKKGEEITRKIVSSTQIIEPIKVVAYVNKAVANADDSDNNSTADSSATSQLIGGTAVKTGIDTWTVIFKNNKQISVTSAELMDPSRFFVKRKWLTEDKNKNKKNLQRRKEHGCQKG